MPPTYFPLRWESTGDQWWFASPIDWAAANGYYDLVRELLHLDTNLLIKLTSLRRIRRLETVWDDEEQFDDVAKCRSLVARRLLLECETKKGQNSLIRAGYGGWLLYTAASAGDVGFVKELLNKDPFLVFGEGEYGVTDVLYAAARSKNSEVFRLLLDSSLSRRDSVNGGHEVEVQPPEVSSVFKWEMINRAVHCAARGGNVELLRELLADCPDVLAYRDAQGCTVLHTASGRGQVEVVKSLVASFDLIKSTDNQGNTALNVAAYRGHLAVVEVLASSSPSTSSMKNNYGDTFVHMTVAGFRSPGFRRLDRQIELMTQLVRGKVSSNIEDIINVRNNEGRTALHMAVIENIQTNLVELLMSVPGINLNIRDADGNTPLDILKQRPQSASSEILIKRLISAGGISNCQDHRTRNVLVSHLKLQGIGGSPGTSFRIPDAEIFLYTGNENASDAGTDFASTDYDIHSGELSNCGSAAGSDSYKMKFGSVNSAARRLKLLLYFPQRKARKTEDNANLEEDASVESYRMSSPEVKPVSLRQRYSKLSSSFSTNKRIVAVPNGYPSPSTKKKFAARLMHGVIQVKRQSSFDAPSSPLSESTWSSPVSTDGERELSHGRVHSPLSSSNHSHKMDKMKMKRHQSSFNMKLMNQYLCFGAQGLTVDGSKSSAQQGQTCKNPVHS